MDTTSLIIIICVVLPALLAISVCVIIFCAHCNSDRKFYRQSSSFDYPHLRERIAHDSYIIDCSRNCYYQQPQRPYESPPVFEEMSPSYDMSINQLARGRTISTFASTHPVTLITNTQQSSSVTTSSAHSAMPPSYAEIFLTPYTLVNA